MARPLRIDLPNAWYHVMNRGHRGGALFLDDADRHRFLGALAELPERFGLEVHCFVLMSNHYHLLVRTSEANLSRAIRWLNVTYAIKFNWAHRCRGTVFQGRFKAVLIQSDRSVQEVARYLHLNPVRIGGLGLSKRDQQRARVADCPKPVQELVNRRIETLRAYQWSSWRIYTGLEVNPGWLETRVIRRSCGGRSRGEQLKALRAYTEEPVRQGTLQSPWEGLQGGIALGEADYVRELLSKCKTNDQEQTAARQIRHQASWDELVKAAEKIRGEPWAVWAGRHGDWGRDAVMHVAVRHGRMRMTEVAHRAGVKYQAAAQAVKRFSGTMADDPKCERFVTTLRKQMSIN